MEFVIAGPRILPEFIIKDDYHGYSVRIHDCKKTDSRIILPRGKNTVLYRTNG